MHGDRDIVTIGDDDLWARCAHRDTTLDPDGGVQLAWNEIEQSSHRATPRHQTGLAFDRWDRGMRSVATAMPLTGGHVQAVSLAPGPPPDIGVAAGPWHFPLGLGIDVDQRLYVAEAGSGDVAIVDLPTDRLLRRASVRSAEHPRRRPVDVATHHRAAWVLTRRPAAIVRFDGPRGPFNGPDLRCPRHRGELVPWRITREHDGPLLVLWRAASGLGVIARVNGHVELTVDGATDIECAPGGILVVARRAGWPVWRFRRDQYGWGQLQPLAAGAYDGHCIASRADGTIVITTVDGVAMVSRRATGGGRPVRFAATGRLVTYRIDSGRYQTRWGRIFADACVPAGGGLVARFISSDDDEVEDPIPWSPPRGRDISLRHAALTPPLPSALALSGLAGLDEGQRFHRRTNGREQPWAQILADDHFDTWESHVRVEPGRYLWVVLDLSGTTASSPRIRELRLEHPGHRLLSYLPRAWSRDDRDVDFLQRFLASPEAIVHELDERAAAREVLLDPRATPQEVLPWLASFVGLTLDRRWSLDARRTLISEAFTLLRRRGTPWMLGRVIEIYLRHPVVLIEQWRLRGGVGGVTLGGRQHRWPAAPRQGDPSVPTLGAITVGGAITSGASGRVPTEDAFATNAHRFTVLVGVKLTTEQRDVVHHLVDIHRPAHTDFEICEVGDGMRVGTRLHVGLTAVPAPSARCAGPMVGSP